MDMEVDCPHLSAVSLPYLQNWLGSSKFQTQVQKQAVTCSQCKTRSLDRLWACLSPNCGVIGCGRMDSSHMQAHGEITKHPLCINFVSGMIWCYTCDNEVLPPEENVKSVQLCHDIRRACLPVTRAVAAPDSVDESMSDVNSTANSKSTKKLGLAGLRNLGNTCYLNAALQALSNCTPFSQYFIKCRAILDQGRLDTPRARLLGDFCDLLQQIWDGHNTVVDPHALVTDVKVLHPSFRGYSQQDTQEFLRSFLDSLHEELKEKLPDVPVKDPSPAPTPSSEKPTPPKPRPKYRSVVDDFFQGGLLSEVTCLSCHKASRTQDVFYDLSVSIPSKKPKKDGKEAKQSRGFLANMHSYFFERKQMTLDDCLTAFVAREQLTGADKYLCEHCKTRNESTKQFSIVKLPEILCIHLKRFRYDSYFGSKVSTSVQFPLDDFDMAPYLTQMPDQPVEKNTCYELVAVINHHGGLGSGHYTSYCKNRYTEQFYLFDDSIVSPVSTATVLKSEAYVLLYRRKVVGKAQEVATVRKLNQQQRTSYVSRSWWTQWKWIANPGPIDNHKYVCSHGSIRNAQRARTEPAAAEQDLLQILKPVSKQAYQFLQERYGGGPEVTELICSQCLELVRRGEAEAARIRQLDSTQAVVGAKWYLMDSDWLRSWRKFAFDKVGMPPGPIDNFRLVDKEGRPRPSLLRADHYRGVNEKVWKFFVDTYGGGPAIVRNEINLYGT